MPPTPWKKSPAELAERFAAALPNHPGIVRKPMFGYPAAFTNGNMVCGLFQDSVVVRLGREGAAAAVAEGRAQYFAPIPGRTMTGYVLVPVAEAQEPKALAAWLQQALDFTLTLPRKAAKPPAKQRSAAKTRQPE